MGLFLTWDAVKIDESCISGASDFSPGAWQADMVLQIGSPALSCAVVVAVVNDSGLVAWGAKRTQCAAAESQRGWHAIGSVLPSAACPRGTHV